MKNTEDVAIFWDYENCNAPANASGYLLASNIASLARPYGTIRQFRAYLEITEQPASSRSTTLRSELQSSGVSLIDCPHNGRKEVADKMLLVDMLAYAIDNPAPATMVIITGDRDFAYALATLKLRRYKLVLITLPHAHISLRCQASVCFDWFGDVVNAANTLAQQTLPSVSSHRHQQRRSSEYGVPKQRSPPLNASRHGSDPTLSHVGSAPDVDINQYLLSPQERRANETFQWDVGCTGLGRKEGTEKATTHDGRIDTPSLRKQTSSVDSLPLPSTLHSKKVEGNHRGLVGRSYQILGTEQPPFFQINGLDDEALSLSSYSIPSTPEGSILGSSTPHSFAVGIPPERNESTVSTTASTSQHFPLPRTSLSLPMNLPYLPSANLADHASAEKPNALDTLASMKICTDPMFNPLIDILRSHMFKGRSHPLRSAVGLELAKRGNVYGKAGAVSFKDYVAMAEKEGLVSLGGRDGHAWITLLDLAK